MRARGGARRGVRLLPRARNLRRRRRQPPGPQSVLEPAPGRQLELERASLARPGSVSRRRRLPLPPRGTGSGGGLSRPVRTAAGSRQGRAFGSRRLCSRQASPTGAGGGMGAFPVCRSGWRGPPWAGEPWARAAAESQGTVGTVGVRAGPGSPWGAGREGTGCQAPLPLAGGRAPPGALGGSPVNHGAPVAPATGGVGGERDRTGPQGSGSHRSSRGSTAQVRGPTPALPFSALFCSALGRPGSRCRLWALLAGLGRGRAAALRPSAGVAPGVPKAVFSLPFDSPFSPRSLLLKASCVGVYGFSVEVVFICFYCFFVPEVGEIILAGGCGVTEMLNSPRARGGFLS